MRKDDTVLPAHSQREVVRYADLLLRKASAVGRFPTPVDDLVRAAKLEVSRESALSRIGLDGLYRRLPNALKLAPDLIKRAASKVLGLLDRPDRVIHLDPTLHPKRRPYITMHEVGHEFLPHQRSTFQILEDSDSELDPGTDDLFEREANVFASEVLFQGDLFTKEAADFAISIDVPVDLSRKYGTSVYATARRYVSTHYLPCALIVFDASRDAEGDPFLALRRVIMSPSFSRQFHNLNLAEQWRRGTFFFDHRPRQKFSLPIAVKIVDTDGVGQMCTAEAFDTTHHILFLVKCNPPRVSGGHGPR